MTPYLPATTVYSSASSTLEPSPFVVVSAGAVGVLSQLPQHINLSSLASTNTVATAAAVAAATVVASSAMVAAAPQQPAATSAPLQLPAEKSSSMPPQTTSASSQAAVQQPQQLHLPQQQQNFVAVAVPHSSVGEQPAMDALVNAALAALPLPMISKPVAATVSVSPPVPRPVAALTVEQDVPPKAMVSVPKPVPIAPAKPPAAAAAAAAVPPKPIVTVQPKPAPATDSNKRRRSLEESEPIVDDDDDLAPDGNDNGEIQCICGYSDDDGFTIQCDKCGVWQHAVCMQIAPSNVPDQYYCQKCSPRPVDKLAAQNAQRSRKTKERARDRRRERRQQQAKEAAAAKHSGSSHRPTVASVDSENSMESDAPTFSAALATATTLNPAHAAPAPLSHSAAQLAVPSSRLSSSSNLQQQQQQPPQQQQQHFGQSPAASSRTASANRTVSFSDDAAAKKALTREELKLQQTMHLFQKMEKQEIRRKKAAEATVTEHSPSVPSTPILSATDKTGSLSFTTTTTTTTYASHQHQHHSSTSTSFNSTKEHHHHHGSHSHNHRASSSSNNSRRRLPEVAPEEESGKRSRSPSPLPGLSTSSSSAAKRSRGGSLSSSTPRSSLPSSPVPRDRSRAIVRKPSVPHLAIQNRPTDMPSLFSPLSRRTSASRSPSPMNSPSDANACFADDDRGTPIKGKKAWILKAFMDSSNTNGNDKMDGISVKAEPSGSTAVVADAVGLSPALPAKFLMKKKFLEPARLGFEGMAVSANGVSPTLNGSSSLGSDADAMHGISSSNGSVADATGSAASATTALPAPIVPRPLPPLPKSKVEYDVLEMVALITDEMLEADAPAVPTPAPALVTPAPSASQDPAPSPFVPPMSNVPFSPPPRFMPAPFEHQQPHSALPSFDSPPSKPTQLTIPLPDPFSLLPTTTAITPPSVPGFNVSFSTSTTATTSVAPAAFETSAAPVTAPAPIPAEPAPSSAPAPVPMVEVSKTKLSLSDYRKMRATTTTSSATAADAPNSNPPPPTPTATPQATA